MKLSESWLREWINPSQDLNALCQLLTMAGLEVEEMEPVAPPFSGIVIGQILKVSPHPKADRLQLCEVDIGGEKTLQIVCGAKNVSAGMKVPVAIVGANLPDKIKIKLTNIRGVQSEGMICSADELGLQQEHDGILALSAQAPIGINFRNYFNLDDNIIDISITPNRGDCLSIKGLAREIFALTHSPINSHDIVPVKSLKKHFLPVSVDSVSGCPRYVGRVIHHVNASQETPAWLIERLKRSGVRSIHPIVDVTNYVMLELGQPMHAFDLDKIKKGIVVRESRQGEKITLLDGSEKKLDGETLIIADEDGPIAMAGVMGGLDSSVTLLTRSIFLESAYFSPQIVARQRQFYGLSSESAYRFERGVDPTIQKEAIERATQLILEITGGEPGEIIELTHSKFLPAESTVSLPFKKVEQVLGISIPIETIESIFDALNFKWQRHQDNWQVRVPPYRFDLEFPEDMIEEIARLYGYDQIPTHIIKASLEVTNKESDDNIFLLRQAVSHLGYQEIISYSFVDKKLQNLLDPNQIPYELLNPISSDMAVMQTNLWPGLINTLIYNKSRQQPRLRLFQIGTVFIPKKKEIQQIQKLAGAITGLAYPEQWANPAREVDFFDLKGDLENIFQAFKLKIDIKEGSHPTLHPGQTAAVYYQEKQVGIFGAIHPAILQSLDSTNQMFLFELDLHIFKNSESVQLNNISKFPEIRRDIAILINQAIPAKAIQDTIKITAGDWLKDVFIFDVYQGKEISPGLKSIALALVWQHPTRTLVDEEVNIQVGRVVDTLTRRLGAELRR